jgi:hypothetical protein
MASEKAKEARAAEHRYGYFDAKEFAKGGKYAKEAEPNTAAPVTVERHAAEAEK